MQTLHCRVVFRLINYFVVNSQLVDFMDKMNLFTLQSEYSATTDHDKNECGFDDGVSLLFRVLVCKAQITKHICQNHRIYLFKLQIVQSVSMQRVKAKFQNVFVKITEYIGSN